MSALVQVRRTIGAPREQVFAAWTDPRLFRAWFKPRGGSIPSVELDVRVGGRYRIALERLGRIWYMVGEYVEVDPPARLVSTFGWQDVPLVRVADSLLTVDFIERDDRTEIVITHERLRTPALRALHGFGWRTTLATLERNLARATR